MAHLTESLLNEYLDNAVNEEELYSIEQHIADCDVCRGKMEDLRRLFTMLAELPEETLQRDLAPFVISHLPDQKISLGWRLILGVQAGLALGLFILLVINVFPLIAQQTIHAAISLRLPFVQLPNLQLPSIVLLTTSLQTSTANLIFLAASALILWIVGNATLLRGKGQI